MKRGLVVLSLIILLSLSFVSANWFTDFFNSFGSTTGHVIDVGGIEFSETYFEGYVDSQNSLDLTFSVPAEKNVSLRIHYGAALGEWFNYDPPVYLCCVNVTVSRVGGRALFSQGGISDSSGIFEKEIRDIGDSGFLNPLQNYSVSVVPCGGYLGEVRLVGGSICDLAGLVRISLYEYDSSSEEYLSLEVDGFSGEGVVGVDVKGSSGFFNPTFGFYIPDKEFISIKGLGESSVASSVSSGYVSDPYLSLWPHGEARLEYNDNWKDYPEFSQLVLRGMEPSGENESAILRPLDAGAYRIKVGNNVPYAGKRGLVKFSIINYEGYNPFEHLARIDTASCSGGFTGYLPDGLVYSDYDTYLVVGHRNWTGSSNNVFTDDPPRYLLLSSANGGGERLNEYGKFDVSIEDINANSTYDGTRGEFTGSGYYWVAIYDGSQDMSKVNSGFSQSFVDLGRLANVEKTSDQYGENEDYTEHNGVCIDRFANEIEGCWYQFNGFWFEDDLDACNSGIGSAPECSSNSDCDRSSTTSYVCSGSYSYEQLNEDTCNAGGTCVMQPRNVGNPTLCVLGCNGATGQCNAENGLLLHLPFDNDFQDKSSYSREVSENGDVSFVEGAVGNASSYDCVGDSIKINASRDFEFSDGDYSLALWVKFPIDGSNVNNGWNGILSYGQTASDLANVWGLLQWSTKSNGLSYNVGSDNPTEGTLFKLQNDSFSNDWHHIAITREDNITTMYIDGEFSQSVEVEDSSNINSEDFENDPEFISIGADKLRDSYGPIRTLEGSIDDVRIYDVALDSDYVFDLYNLTNVGEPNPPVDAGACNADREGFRKKDSGRTLYCNGQIYVVALADGQSCDNHYQCVNNSCLDGTCQSVVAEVKTQTGTLKNIWCALTNLGDFFNRNDAGKNTSLTNDYWACSAGLPTECVDSDGGINDSVKGNCTGIYDEDDPTKTFGWDECKDGSSTAILWERTCVVNECAYTVVNCTAQGKVCDDGRCVADTTPLVCVDSDAGEGNYTTFGNATRGNTVVLDVCDTIEILNESICSSASPSVPSSIQYNCSLEGKSCVSGKCVGGCLPGVDFVSDVENGLLRDLQDDPDKKLSVYPFDGEMCLNFSSSTKGFVFALKNSAVGSSSFTYQINLLNNFDYSSECDQGIAIEDVFRDEYRASSLTVSSGEIQISRLIPFTEQLPDCTIPLQLNVYSGSNSGTPYESSIFNVTVSS